MNPIKKPIIPVKPTVVTERTPTLDHATDYLKTALKNLDGHGLRYIDLSKELIASSYFSNFKRALPL